MSAATAAAIVGAAASVKSGMDSKEQAKSAQASQEGQTARSQAFAEQQQAQARADLQSLFPQAQAQQQAGFQGALDAFKTTIPAQTQAFSQGNQQAQGTISAGLPQMQRALLGLPTDFSGLQAQNIQPQGLDALNAMQLAPAPNISLTSPEDEAQNAQRDSAVTSLYQELLGRDPDPSGFAWAQGVAAPNGIVSPQGLADLRTRIMGSSEFQQSAAPQQTSSLGFNF